MASGTDYLNALSQYHPGVNLGSSTDLTNQANQAAASGQDINDFATKNANNPAIGQAYVNHYQTFAQPTIDGINTQIGTLGTQGQITNQQYGNNVTQLNNDSTQAQRQIGFSGADAQASSFNAANSAGLANTGNYAGASQRIASDQSNALSYNEANRANQLGQLMLQNQSNQNSIQGTVNQLQSQKAATQQTVSQSAQDAQLQNSDRYFNRNLQLAQMGTSLPTGRSIQVAPGYTVQGNYQNPAAALDLIKQNIALFSNPGARPLIKQVLQQNGIAVDDATLNQFAGQSPVQQQAPQGNRSTLPTNGFNPSRSSGGYTKATGSNQSVDDAFAQLQALGRR